jgi:hypothetical protein
LIRFHKFGGRKPTTKIERSIFFGHRQRDLEEIWGRNFGQKVCYKFGLAMLSGLIPPLLIGE